MLGGLPPQEHVPVPRSFNHLWEQVVSWDNLMLAWHRCRRHKRFKPEAARFAFEWESNLLTLQQELCAGVYQPGAYRHFRIQEPKPRLISAAPFRDRVVHHAVVGVLEPIFERRFIHDSYACRKGKGTHLALDRAQQFLRRHPFVLKTDIVKFFPCVDHDVLLETIARTVHDPRLMELIRTIIASGQGVLDGERPRVWFPGDDLFAMLRPCGLPIGNLTSQFFANVLLDRIDHFVKEELRIPGYVRYADDLLLFADEKSILREALTATARRLAQLRLRLHPEKTQIVPCASGIGFLGCRLAPTGRRLKCSAIRRFNRRLRLLRWRFAQGLVDTGRVSASLRAWLAYAEGKTPVALRRSLFRTARFRRKSRPPAGA